MQYDVNYLQELLSSLNFIAVYLVRTIDMNKRVGEHHIYKTPY